jgi:hypothetical protein
VVLLFVGCRQFLGIVEARIGFRNLKKETRTKLRSMILDVNEVVLFLTSYC